MSEQQDQTAPAQGSGRDRGGRPWRWTAAALLVFGLGTAVLFRGFWGADLRRLVPTDDQSALARADVTFVAWLVARNAYTWASRPWQLFDAEPCHPAEKALALGEPGLTLGLLGVPAWLASGDPLVTFNFVAVLLPLLSALAMYLVVRAWTGVPAAGIAAGAVYAFHPIKSLNVTHPYVADNVWTLLALFFAQRLFARGRWRDAVGLSLCVALQMGGSFYPMLAAAAVGLPFAGWLLFHYRLRHVRSGQLLLVAALLALSAWLFYAPFFELRAEGTLEPRGLQMFMAWRSFLPSSPRFLGWALLLLVGAALALPRRRSLGGLAGDPRWALLFGALLATLLATGGSAGDFQDVIFHGAPPPAFKLPNLYAALTQLAPGLDVVRLPRRIFSGTHLTLSLLAGLGVAALVRITPGRFAPVAAAALIAFAWLETMRPPLLGMQPRIEWEPLALRPSEASLRFFQRLEQLDNRGPLLDIPSSYMGSPSSVLLSAYHHRRVGHCLASYVPAEVVALRHIDSRLPDPAELRALAERGFTTLVVHDRLSNVRFARFARGPYGDLLRRVHGDGTRTAWDITGALPLVEEQRAPAPAAAGATTNPADS